MKIRYTVTETRCPFCGYVLSRKNDFWLHWLSIGLFLIVLPVLIAKPLLDKFAFQEPDVPSVGRSVMFCTHCGKFLKTGKKELKDLSGLDLLNYKFNWLFKLSYFLGGVIILLAIVALFFIFDSGIDYSFIDLIIIVFLSIFIIGIITYSYRKRLNKILNNKIIKKY